MKVAGLRAHFTGPQLDVAGEVEAEREPTEVPAHSRPFLFVGRSVPRVSVDFAWVPRPVGVEVSGFSEDVAEQLGVSRQRDPARRPRSWPLGLALPRGGLEHGLGTQPAAEEVKEREDQAGSW